MKKISLLLGAIMVLLPSCTKEISQNEISEGKEITITAYANTQTKTGLVADGAKKSVVWESGDAISLFFNSGSEGGNKFTTTSSGSVATFTGTISAISGDLSGNGGTAYFWGLYPYNASASCDGTYITTSLPDAQTSPAGDVADNLLVTVGRSENLSIYFKNTLSVIAFTVSQENISKVVFSGNAEEKVAGEYKISFNDSEEVVDTPTDNAKTSVTITPSGTGTFTVGSTYYFACIPGTFSAGYSLKFTKSDRSTATYSSSTSVALKSSTFYDMDDKDYGLEWATEGNGNNPLTFTSNGSTTISLVKQGSPAEITLQYSKNGESLTDYTIGDVVSLNDGETVSFQAAAAGNSSFSKDSGTNYHFSIGGEGDVSASGNIMSLLDRTMATTIPCSYCFISLFSGCTSLTSAPELPATTLADYCYYCMFYGCTKLTSAPELPATTLADYCYYCMFSDCTSLTSAPELPATTLAEGCYSCMFTGCTSLTSAPELPATTLADYCYNSMFNGCSGLTSAPELPATTLAEGCYRFMFSSCTGLTSAPELPATTLVTSCYGYMFFGCSKLNYVKALFTTTPSGLYMALWLNGVSSNGTFVKSIIADWDVTGEYGIPEGWIVEYGWN